MTNRVKEVVMKRIYGITIVFLVAGLVVGYIVGFGVYQPQISSLQGTISGLQDTARAHEEIEVSNNQNATLHVVVTDNATNEPIENAIVYLGTGFWKHYTDDEGKCVLSGVPWGDYGVGVFRKEYHRFQESRHLVAGDNFLAVELERRAEIPDSFTIEGTVVEIVTAEGTRSENHCFKVREDSGTEEYIFDDVGMNRGFTQFVNKEVRITGYRDVGYIGWEHEEAEGIYVEEIEVNNNQNACMTASTIRSSWLVRSSFVV